MNLTLTEIQIITNRLADILADNFYEAVYDCIGEREGNEELEVTEEDVLAIKKQLKGIL